MANDNQYNEDISSLDEIVFQKRNKEYGAYDLRKNYSKILLRSFLIGTTLFCVVALVPFIYATVTKNKKDTKNVVVMMNDIDEIPEDEIIEEDKPEEQPPPPPPKPEEQPPQQEIIKNVVPEPTKNPEKEEIPPPIDTQKQTKTGLIDQDGEKNPDYTPRPSEPPKNPGTGNTPPPLPKEPELNLNDIQDKVDEKADFKGGMDKFRENFQDEFDVESMEGEGVVETIITFVVERDGRITDIKATGSNTQFNKEAESAIRRIKPNWTPAKIKGQTVRSRFRFPVKMEFQ